MFQLHPSRQIRKISRNVTSSARCLYNNGYANLTNTSSFNKLIWIASLYYKSPIFVGLILASTRFKFPIVEDHISLLRVSHFPKKNNTGVFFRAFVAVISKLDKSSNPLIFGFLSLISFSVLTYFFEFLWVAKVWRQVIWLWWLFLTLRLDRMKSSVLNDVRSYSSLICRRHGSRHGETRYSDESESHYSS